MKYDRHRCYVCGADPHDGCNAVDGEVAECPRPSRREASDDHLARIQSARQLAQQAMAKQGKQEVCEPPMGMETPAPNQTPPPDAHGPEFDNGPDCAKTSGECTCGLDGGNPDLCEHYLWAQARRQSEKGNKDAEHKGKWFLSEKVACHRQDGCQTPSKCENAEACPHQGAPH